MKPGLKVGDSYALTLEITEAMRGELLGQLVHPLYGTAAMVAHMEWAARQHVLPYLEPDEEYVGYRVDIRHRHPAPVGARVTVRATVTDLSSDRVTCHAEATCGEVLLGEATVIQARVNPSLLYQKAAYLST